MEEVLIKNGNVLLFENNDVVIKKINVFIKNGKIEKIFLDDEKSKIYEDLQKKQNAEIEDERRSKIGTGDRAEKIRTYNYPQNRVTDHRINLTIMQLDRIMQGKLDEIIEALINEDQRRKLAGE